MRNAAFSLYLVIFAMCFLPGCGHGETQSTNEIKEFLISYFDSWSRNDMVSYKSHFSEDAYIAFLWGGRVIGTARLDEFIRSQALVHANSSEPMIERMLDFEVEQDKVSASVTVQCELRHKNITKYGVDRFILARNALGEWKIVSLVFYETGP